MEPRIVHFFGGPLNGQCRPWEGGRKIVYRHEGCEGCGGRYEIHVYEVTSEKPDVIAHWKGVGA